MAGGARVCLGQIGAAHGVRGEVRLHSFTADPAAIVNYGPLETEDGRSSRSKRCGRPRIISWHGLRASPIAMPPSGWSTSKLYVPRERLPEPEEPDEFYHADLIGLRVVDRAGQKRGTVVAVHNFGAGDLIEMRPDDGGKTELLPFDAATVPKVDLAAGRWSSSCPRQRD